MHHKFSLIHDLSVPSKPSQLESTSISELSTPTEENNEREKTNETGFDSKEVVKWLLSDTGTPKSILRDRATYYNNELVALKEMTDKEKELLNIEHQKEIEKYKSKIEKLENDIKFENSIKNQLESEKRIMQNKNDELKKKNAELSRINFQLQKVQNINNDAEYMLEMMQQKFKKREMELLEQLTEARQQNNLNIVPSYVLKQLDVTKKIDVSSQSDLVIQVDVATQSDFNSESSDVQSEDFVDDTTNISDDISLVITSKLEDYKNKINFIKEELITTDYVGPDLITTFNELNKQSEELSNELNNYSEDIQEQFLTLKSMLQNITYLFTFEKTIKNHELETSKYVNRIAQNQRKELTYEKLVKEQGDEIKHLSKKLLDCMQREQDLKTQLDLLEADKEELEKSQKTEISKLKKEYTQIINSKDKEIEDLSDKIMEYIDLITPLEEDSKKYKELIQENLNTENIALKELNDKLDSCTTQINSLTEELQRNQNEIEMKNETIAQLKIDVEEKKLNNEENKNEDLQSTIQSLTEQLDSKSNIVSQLQNNMDALQQEIENKNKEISELQNDITSKSQVFMEKTSLLEEQNKELDSIYQELKLNLQKKAEEISAFSEQISFINLEHNNKITDLQREINEANQQVSKLREELKIKETLLKETNEQLLKEEGEKEELKIKIKDQWELIQLQNIELESIKQKLINDRLETENPTEIINETSKKSKILEEKVQYYEEQLALKDKKMQIYKNELCTKKSLIKQLSNEIELLNEKIITYESHIDALANQIEEQSKNIESQNKQILEMNNQIYKYQEDTVFMNKPSIIINSEENLMKPGKDMVIVNRSDLIDYENQIKNYKQVCGDQIAELTSFKERINDYQNKFEIFESTLNVFQDVVFTKYGEYIKVNEDNRIITQLIEDAKNAIETLKIQISEQKELSPEVLKDLIVNYKLELEHFISNENKLETNKLLLEQKRNEVSVLTNELTNINQKLDTCKDEINSLSKEKEFLEQQLTDYQQRDAELSLSCNVEKQDLEIETLNSKLVEAQNELQSHESNMENLMSSVQSYKNQIDEYLEGKSKLEKLLHDKENKKELLNQKIIEYKEQQINIIKNIESLKEQIVTKTGKLENFMQENLNLDTSNQLDQEITLLCAEINKYEQKLNNYELDAKMLTNILTWSSIFLDNIENKRSLFDNEIQSLQNKFEQATQEIVELKNKIISLNNEVQDLNKREEVTLEEKDCEIKTLKETLNKEKQKYEQYTQEIIDLNDKITALNKQVQDLIKENENSITEKDIEIKALKESINNEKQKYEQQIQELNLIQEELKTIKSQNLDEENNILTQKVDRMEKQIQERNLREKELEEKIKYFENLCAEIDTLKADCLQKEKTNVQYINKIQNLTAKLNKATIELQSFKDKYIDKENEMEITKQSLETKELIITKINEEINEKNNELITLKNEFGEAKSKKDEIEFKYNKDIQEKLNEIKKLNDKIQTLEKYQLNENFEKEFSTIVTTQIDKIEKHNELIKTVNGYSQKIESCNKAVSLVRSQLEIMKNTLKLKEEQLKIVLEKILNHMKPKCEICTDTDIETFTQQCNLAFSTNEVKKLRHENSEYKGLVAKIRQKANSQIGNFQNILVNVQSENEKLKISESTKIDLIKTLKEKIQNLEIEIAKTTDENSEFATLQRKVQTLEQDNRDWKKMVNYLQEQTTQKINELKDYKNHLDFHKKENTELLKSNADYLHLKKKLAAAEASLKTAQASIKQLEMEKDNFNATSRSLEESLEDAKFELYALKNKERERMKKHKRRSLHDSSRVLSEPAPIEQQQQEEEDLQHNKSDEMKQDKENQINSECERCKERENEYENRFIEISKLKDEIKTLRRKYDICKGLCLVRKRKIGELEMENRRGKE